MYKEIDLENWNRKTDYEFFTEHPSMVYMSANMEASRLFVYAKAKGLRPYICILYAVCRCISELEAFRMSYLEKDGKLIPVIYDQVRGNYPVLNNDGHPINKLASTITDFKAFYADVDKGIADARVQQVNSFHKEGNFFLTSYVPYNFSSTYMVTEQLPKPMVTWGKTQNDGDKKMLPVSISYTHTFVDGQDFVDFFQLLEEYLQQPEKMFE